MDADHPEALPGHALAVTQVAFSPNGKLLASASADQTVLIRDAAGKKLRRLEGFAASVSSLAWLPDSKTLLTGSGDGVLRLWDATTGKLTRRLDNVFAGGTVVVAVSPDGRRLAVACWAASEYWRLMTVVRGLDVASGKVLWQQRLFNEVSALAFSPDSQRVAAGTKEGHPEHFATHLYDAATGEQRGILRGHAKAVTSVAFLSNHWLVTAGLDDSVRLWDVRAAEKAGYLYGNRGHLRPPTVLAFSADGKILASGGEDGWVCLWNTQGDLLRALMEDGPVRALAFSADGEWLLSSTTQSVLLWKVATGDVVASHQATRSKAVFAADGKTYAVSEDRAISVWFTGTRARALQVTGLASQANALAFSPTANILASGQEDGSLAMWSTATAKPLLQIEKQTGPMHALAFSPDGLLLASVGEQAVLLWDAASGALVEKVPVPGGPFGDVMFGPGGTTVILRKGGAKMKLVELGPTASQILLPNHSAETAAALAPDCRTFATGHLDTTLMLWKTAVVERAGAAVPAAGELVAAWKSLSGSDAVAAYRARQTLLAGGKATVALLRAEVRAAVAPDQRMLAKWIAELDDAKFKVREKATAELLRHGEMAQGPLKEVLKGKPTLEVRQRVEQLLAKIADQPIPPATWRSLTAIAVLEGIGDASAREVLEELSRGLPGMRVTAAAQAALQRLGKRKA
jgi:WD40 repeat protein